MRHFVTLNDISTDEFHRILELGTTIKRELKQGVASAALAGKVMGMIFEKQSLRTRVSFEAGMFQLGGTAMSLGSEIGFGKRESVKDIAQVLSSMVDVIMFRALQHKSVVDLAAYSTCPVINGLTDEAHPCQALSDMLTIYEIFGQLQGIKLAWVGDANNVAVSLLRASAKLGLKMSIAAPAPYQFDSAKVNRIVGTSPMSGFEVELTDDPAKAVCDAHVVYTDVWVSMGQESEEAQRKQIFAPYQVDGNLLSKARSEAVFLHCLPARRGMEVTDEVIDSPQSRVVQQAENRLHAQKGLLVWLLNEAMAEAFAGN
jgi:ornithine carbamoyltransferase